MSRGGVRYGIFVHEPDGDMGYGRILGAYLTPGAAVLRAEKIRKRAERDERYVECLVLPLLAGSTSAADVLYELGDPD